MLISFIIPTRDRPAELDGTLARLAQLRLSSAEAEVIIVDNASAHRPRPVRRLANGLAVTTLDLRVNRGAAARNDAASIARGAWLVMLDDDSAPLDAGLIDPLRDASHDTAAITADIVLSTDAHGLHRRESGGLPEVPVGCGVAYRRDVFLDLGGYDPSFHYYAEEYDLAARLIAAGHRVAFSQSFRVEHRKVAQGRDMNTILARLVRNNGWVMQRYAPPTERPRLIEDIIDRYRAIAIKEHATEGFDAGLRELDRTLTDQPQTPLAREHWERFIGLHAARAALQHEISRHPFASAMLVERGKHDWVIERALLELGMNPLTDAADALVIGTMSPGPMIDAADRVASGLITPQRIVVPWLSASRHIAGLHPPAVTVTDASSRPRPCAA